MLRSLPSPASSSFWASANPDAPALLRSYSLSDTPSADHYRVSIKQELNGVASTYLHSHVQVGDYWT